MSSRRGLRPLMGRAVVGVLAGMVVSGLVLVAPGLAKGAPKVEITWFVGLGAPPEGAKERKKAINGVVKAFNQENPDVKLLVDIVPSDTVYDALGARIATGKALDVIGPVGLRERDAFADSFADLRPLATAAGFDLAAFDPGLLTAYQDPGGSLVGLPFGVFPSIMYYNKDLFNEALLAYPPSAVGDAYVMPDGTEVPWDWDTVAEIAKRLTVDANGNDATSPDFDPEHIAQFGYANQFGEFRRDMTSLGGAAHIVTPDGTGYTFTIPDTWDRAVAWYHDAIFRDHFMPTGEQVASPLLANNPFGSGNVAMAVAPLWYTCCMSDAAGTRLQNWDIGVMPVGLTGVTTSPVHADDISISAASPHQDEAFRVLQYLLNDPRARALYAVAPAPTAQRAAYYAGLNQTYPRVANWSAADAMLAYPDIPSHQGDFPGYTKGQARLGTFYALIQSDAGADIDMGAEMDKLQADLQAIIDEAMSAP